MILIVIDPDAFAQERVSIFLRTMQVMMCYDKKYGFLFKRKIKNRRNIFF